MNKKILPVITFGVAMLLVGSIAYASERRKNSKSKDQLANTFSEEEILISELQNIPVYHDKKATETDDVKRLEDLMADADDITAAASVKTRKK